MPAEILRLQRAVGNRAVGRLLQALRTPAVDPASVARSGDAVLQRAVGFEFQCRKWKVEDANNKLVESNKGQVLTSGTGWSLMSDGGDPEFVVGHVDERDPKALVTPMKEITAFAADVAKNGRRQLDLSKSTHGKKLKSASIEPRGEAEAEVTADPQITAGVRFERLATLMEQLSRRDPFGRTAQSGANANLMQNRQVSHYTGDDLLLGRALSRVREVLQRDQFADTLAALKAAPAAVEGAIGTIALITSYVMKGPRLGHAYIKDFPLLSKSDLSRVMEASPLARLDRDALGKVYLVIVVAAGRGNSREQIYDPTKLDSNKPDQDGPTVEQWVESLLYEKKDLLSYLKNSKFADNSMGNLSRLDQVGPDAGAAPILEFRRINDTLPSSKWAPFAAQILSWIASMNDLTGTEADYQPPP